MKRAVLLRTSLDKSLEEGMISITVSMDKEMFTQLLHSYKLIFHERLMANKKVLMGDDITCISLVREILHAAEEGCKNEL